MTMRLRAALTCTMLLVLAACASGTTSDTGEVGTGGRGEPRLAAIKADTVDGATFDAASLGGRPAVLWFWAPWCTICRAEASGVRRAASSLHDRVTFVGVAGRGERPAMQQFVADTATSGFVHVADDDGKIWNDFGVIGQPAFAFIDSGGNVEVVDGSLTSKELLARARALVDDRAGS